MPRARFLAAVVACVMVGAGVSAQSSAEVNAGIQYNFASPGARSMGRAGAFIAEASDATAVYANPAGLVNLPGREVSIELRRSRFVNEYSDRGHAFGSPSGEGTDTIAGIRTGRTASVVSSAPFASVVFPFRRITVAAYRHELANFSAAARTQGVFFDLPGIDTTPISGAGIVPQPQVYRHYPSVSSMRLKIAAVGLAAAARLTDRLSVGVVLREADAELQSTTRRYETTTFYGPPDYTRLNNVQTQSGSGHSFGVNAGFLLDLTDRVSVGGTYRPGFSLPLAVTYTDALGERPELNGRFHVPTFYGAGVSVRPTDDWSLALDVDRIGYSAITRGFVLLFTEEPRYFIPDATEIRAGSEWLLTSDRGGMFERLRWPLALDAGVWRNPDHSIRVSDASDSQAILFRSGRADYHFCGGIGVIFGSAAQVHLAADRSRRQTLISLTTMARF